MPQPTDDELRDLLEAAASAEGEERLAAMLEENPALRERLANLSGESEFGTYFESAERRTENPPELRELITALQSDPDLTPAPLEHGRTQVSESTFLEYLSPSNSPQMLGSLGEYQVEAIIAIGGMGVVYRAHDPELERTVAIKMLSPVFVGSEEAKERFHREARAAAAVEHPNVIAIYAVDRTTAALPFFVMQYIGGESLAQRLQGSGDEGTAFPLDEVLHLARGIAAGLAAAHGQGSIHRDIKPSNILLERNGPGIWVTDFGLARSTSDPALTRTNMFVGTPGFAAPEQCEGREIDHRADLFSFGAVLYLLVTGRRPFQGESFAALVYQIVHEAHPPVREVAPDCPGWFAQLIDRLLAKDPGDRYQSAQDVLANLEREETSVARPGLGPRPWGRRRLWLGAAAGAGFLGILAFLVLPLPPRDPGPPSALNAKAPAGSGLFALHAGKAGAAVRRFPDLRSAIEAAGADNLIEIETSETVSLAGTIEIPAGKFLTIRAARGQRPVLAGESAGAMLFTQSSLILEGLTIEQPAHRHTAESAVMRSMRAPLFLANCRFLRPPSEIRRGQMTLGAPFMAVAYLAECRFINCEIYSPDSACALLAVDAERAGSARIENSVLVGSSALILKNETTQKGRVQLVENYFLSRSFLGLQATLADVAAYALTVERNVIKGRTLCVASLRIGPEGLVKSLDWKGRGNLYGIWGRWLLGGGLRGASLETLNEKFAWGEREPGSRILESSPEDERMAFHSMEELRAIDPASFAEEPNEPGGAQDVGPDFARVGPGEAYHRWRETEEYQSWIANARESCRKHLTSSSSQPSE